MRKPRYKPDLPDVNVLVALFDPAHVHHIAAHEWFAEARHKAWATCPLTQSSFLRIVSNPAYPNRNFTPEQAASYLRQLIANHPETHRFVKDETSLLDTSRYNLSRLGGHRQITDLHLLGVCLRARARLVTFDKGYINLAAAVLSPVEILLLEAQS
jgi:toxin-antitoxin system PIN domain toxin